MSAMMSLSRARQDDEVPTDGGEVLHVQARFTPEQVGKHEEACVLRRRPAEGTRKLVEAVQGTAPPA
jgi:hypothetical protein